MPPPVTFKRVEDTAGKRLLALDVSVDVADLDTMRILTTKRHPRPIIKGDLIVFMRYS
jgi:hypothetical protein